jgi:hypothetical protein
VPPIPRLYTPVRLPVHPTKQSPWSVSSLNLLRNRSDDTDEQQDKDDHHGREPSHEGPFYAPRAPSSQVSPRTQSLQGQSPPTSMPTAQSNVEQSTVRSPPPAPLSEAMVRASFSGPSGSSQTICASRIDVAKNIVNPRRAGQEHGQTSSAAGNASGLPLQGQGKLPQSALAYSGLVEHHD